MSSGAWGFLGEASPIRATPILRGEKGSQEDDRAFSRMALIAGCVPLIGQQQAAPPPPPVTPQMLVDDLKDPARWLMFGGDYSARRHSPLTQITHQNVSQLIPQWLFQTAAAAPGRGLESTPLVADGVMYLTGKFNHAWTLDARTG